jgi:hypothetical protein
MTSGLAGCSTVAHLSFTLATMTTRRGAPPFFRDVGGPLFASSTTQEVASVVAPGAQPRWGSLPPTSEGWPSADAGSAHRHTQGPRTKIEEGESRRGGAPPGDCRSASADHRRPTGQPPPATATPAPPPAGGRGRSKGQLLVRVRGNPNRTPTSFMRGHMGQPGRQAFCGPFTGQIAHRPHSSLRSRSPSDPPQLSTSPENPPEL